MGLDMYLTAKRYLFNFVDEAEAKVSKTIALHFPELKGKQVKEIGVRFGYWRKVNQIHQWFVERVQDGEDNCEEYEVSRELLEELRFTVMQVLADHSQASVLLPVQEGFFFGSTEYEEDYFADLEATLVILNDALDDGMSEWDFYYRASW
jgi:hypothetical protein